jgi:hypothetical protein
MSPPIPLLALVVVEVAPLLVDAPVVVEPGPLVGPEVAVDPPVPTSEGS